MNFDSKIYEIEEEKPKALARSDVGHLPAQLRQMSDTCRICFVAFILRNHYHYSHHVGCMQTISCGLSMRELASRLSP